MKRNLPVICRRLRDGLYRVQVVSGKWWFKSLAVLLALFILWQKNLRIEVSFGNGSAGPLATTVAHGEEGPPPSMQLATFSPLEANEGPVLSEQEQRIADQFPNIGFSLNPDYARRKNIPKNVVAHKQTICKEYIRQYAKTAVTEMELYRIPASITLAQGLLESDAGGSLLAKEANNHFGVKCFSKTCKKGHCRNMSDDSHKDFFINYPSAWRSFRAHSKLLQKERYAHLLKLSLQNYRDWAYGLQAAGYATDKRYAEKLIQLIEHFDLQRFDHLP